METLALERGDIIQTTTQNPVTHLLGAAREVRCPKHLQTADNTGLGIQLYLWLKRRGNLATSLSFAIGQIGQQFQI